MPCKACGENDSLEVCLSCGHSFCRMHRADRGGVPTCTPCVKEDAERARKIAQAAAGKAAAGRAAAGPVVDVNAPAPLPEPKSALKPILVGLAVAAPAARYLYWLGERISIDHDLPAWSQTALTALGSLFVFAGVWAIVKTKS